MVNEISGKDVPTVLTTTTPANSADNANVKHALPATVKQDDTELAKATSQLGMVEKTAQMAETADQLNQITQRIDRNLKFSVDDRSGDIVIAVIDRKTEEVIRQIPEDRVLAMRENIDSLKGILFSAKI